MSGHEYPPSGENTDDTSGSRKHEIAERLSDLVDNVGMDPTIAQAYTPEASELYAYPGMGPALTDRLDDLKLQSLRNFQELYELAYGMRFRHPDMQRLVREARQALGGTSELKLGESLLVGLARDTQFGPAVARAMDMNMFGVRQRPLVLAAVKANYLHYFPEFGVSDIPLPDDGTLGDVSDFAFGAEGPQPSRASTLAYRLRQRGVVDLSQTHLDERRANLQGIAQLEAAGQLLDNLAFLSLARPLTGARTAFALASRYHDALLTDDSDGKVALAQQLASEFRQYGRQMRNRQARQVVTAAGRDAAMVAGDLSMMRWLFDRVYAALGYERPSSAVSGTTTSAVDTAAVAAEAAVGHDLPAETDVRQRAAALESQWCLSSRQHRKRGFTAMQHTLVTGEPAGAAAEPAIHAIPKESARQLIDVLAHLHDLAADLGPDEARRRLAAAVDEQRLILDRAGQLREAARADGRQVDPVAVVPLREILLHLRAAWPAYRRLVRNTWPEGGGAQASRLLEPLLSESTNADEVAPSWVHSPAAGMCWG
jgi:hypothetical protein